MIFGFFNLPNLNIMLLNITEYLQAENLKKFMKVFLVSGRIWWRPNIYPMIYMPEDGRKKNMKALALTIQVQNS